MASSATDVTNLTLPAGDDRESLRATHALHAANVGEWQLLLASYEGVRSLVALSYVLKHERESDKNYQRRLRELFGFTYSRSIVDIFNFYLFKKPVKRAMGTLSQDPAWRAFTEDCDLQGTSFDELLTDMGRYASIYGFVGLLVDKPTAALPNRQAEIAARVYPYVAVYHPPAILDWKFERDAFNRPFLAFLKLLDDDGQYRLWWRDRWEVWVEPKAGDERTADDDKAILLAEGQNPLGEIPFVFLYNLKPVVKPIGVSDIHDIARIDLSIIRNLSQGEEIVNYGAFPMMRRPMREAGKETRDETGPTAVLEFDPENPGAKPDWLPAEVAQPLGAIGAWIERKIAEIYRSSNAGGMAATEIQTQARSGAAIKAEFQLLNSKLVQKAVNLEKSERKLLRYWLRWQGLEGLASEIKIERARTYEVENLAADLENALTSTTIVKSRTFTAQIQKQVARQMLPAADEELLGNIDREIEAAREALPQVEAGQADTPAAQGEVAAEVTSADTNNLSD